MTTSTRFRRWLVDEAILYGSGLVFAWVLIALLAVMPYAGINLSTSDGRVINLYVTGAGLEREDRVLSIGGVSIEAFSSDRNSEFFAGVEPGQVVPIVIERDGVIQTVDWVFPGPTAREIWERLFSNMTVGLLFLAAGAFTALVVRPRDERWRLLMAFFCVSSIWLVASQVSGTHVWGTEFILRSSIWLSVPIYWHLHWNLPAPLIRLPRAVWVAVYGAGVLLAVMEWFAVLPAQAYQLGLVAALGPVPLLWLAHAVFQRSERSSVLLLGLLVLLILLPLIGTLVISAFGFPAYGGAGAFFLFALPFIYLIVIFRRRLGGLQFRVNYYISLFAYYAVLGTAGVMLTAVAAAQTDDSGGALTVGLTAGLAGAVVTGAFQRRFQYWFQQKFLGMRLPPTQVLDSYSTRIASSLTAQGLTELLERDVLPSLLVREALLLRAYETRPPEIMLQVGQGITPPTRQEAAALRAEAGRYRLPEQSPGGPCPWVRAPFALVVNERLVGWLLLGRRDPDDFYDRSEMDRIGTLAQQVAVALSHIVQSQQLLDLNQHNLSVTEAERTSLARELHDGPMNRLANLLQHLPPDAPAELADGIRGVIDSLRRTAAGQRPPTLDYGLHTALRSLVHDAEQSAPPETTVTLTATTSGERYPPEVELHLFRIAQQACHNALQHAAARAIEMGGTLGADHIELTIHDDGRGFATSESLELGDLVARRHFGLAGMHERATWIGAHLEIHSDEGQGTRVRVRWTMPNPSPGPAARPTSHQHMRLPGEHPGGTV